MGGLRNFGGGLRIFLGHFQQIINIFLESLASLFDWHPCWVIILGGVVLVPGHTNVWNALK